MRTVEATDLRSRLPVDALRSVFADHPVRFAILFGSYATEREHAGSDVDVAVEFTDLQPSDVEYNDVYLALGVDVSRALETDDVDVVDVHTLSRSLARMVFDQGVLLYGDRARAEAVRDRLVTDSQDGPSPRERLDDALQRIDEHLA